MGIILADETKIKVIKQPRYFYLNQAHSEKKEYAKGKKGKSKCIGNSVRNSNYRWSGNF